MLAVGFGWVLAVGVGCVFAVGFGWLFAVSFDGLFAVGVGRVFAIGFNRLLAVGFDGDWPLVWAGRSRLAAIWASTADSSPFVASCFGTPFVPNSG